MRLIFALLAAATLLTAVTPAGAQQRRREVQSVAAAVPTPEPMRYCRKYGQRDAKALLLGVDRSTGQIRPIDVAGINAAYADLQSLMAEGDRVVVFTLFDHPSTRRVLFDDCRPGGPLGWTDTPHDAAEKRADLRDFDHALSAVITSVRDDRGATAPRAAQRSAIASTLAATVQSTRAEIKALILMTDLLDTETMNLRPGTVVEEHIRRRTIESLWAAQLVPRLGGDAKVHVYGFGRGDENPYAIIEPSVMTSIIQVWRDYFRRSGVNPANTEFIP
ncbi:exported hypothetical protein [Magnetospirillum sp. LM-5]|uniref:hypothetical protein n=1 Tax=Magnetospirillum sp. LM-5 TaxID=2681466 RepID=UPI0013864AE9|nr:hypothetical protein [Magnetospirillum sp. LM-5]CAA7622991.1 exported hypothetical protein [Magnetospirillum sp. LM-5]